MAQAKLGDRLGDAVGLVGIEGIGQPGLYIAEGAGPRAGVAHDHHGGVAMGPAFADIGTAGLFADRVEPMLLHDRPGRGIFLPDRRLDPDPVRLAADGAFRAFRLLGMAQRAQILGVLVENGGHGSYIEIRSTKITQGKAGSCAHPAVR